MLNTSHDALEPSHMHWTRYHTDFGSKVTYAHISMYRPIAGIVEARVACTLRNTGNACPNMLKTSHDALEPSHMHWTRYHTDFGSKVTYAHISMYRPIAGI